MPPLQSVAPSTAPLPQPAAPAADASAAQPEVSEEQKVRMRAKRQKEDFLLLHQRHEDFFLAQRRRGRGQVCDGEGVEHHWGWGTGLTDGEPAERACVDPAPKFTDGEQVERMWADLNPISASTRQMAPGFCRSNLESTGEIHKLRIISTHGVRDVQCDCDDGQHSVYEHRQAFAFRDADGYIVIKKDKSCLLALE
ncbi:hypothetical protein DFH06DRAFT_1335485 [Mycena polygramma]|nr:hypothetical protein DFH06DRAFT_1335485 [Mycena polygramma]